MPARLPEYEVVMRWTVQDVINWLQSDKKFGAFVKPFREAAVDGRKLCKLTDTELVKMRNCPLAKKSDLLRCLTVFEGRGNTPPPDMSIGTVMKERRGVIQPPSDSESDDWFSDDFSEDDEPLDLPPPLPGSRVPQPTRKLPEPVVEPPPSIPARPPKIIQDDYEEPTPPIRKDRQTLPPVPKPTKSHNPPHDNSSSRRERPPPPPPTDRPGHVSQDHGRKHQTSSHTGHAAVSSKEDLSGCDWYHGMMSRGESERLLMHYQVDGMFLVRDSTKNPDQPYTLVVYSKNRVCNLAIKKETTSIWLAPQKIISIP
ncbi:hypothetical protein ScPMuIL_002730 [Solemya velum]